MIEIDLPEGQAIPTADQVKQITDPNWLASWWHISDVHSQANNGETDDAWKITDDEAREVLRLIDEELDANNGVCWDVIDDAIDRVKDQRKKRRKK